MANFMLYGGPGAAAGIRIEGVGHADPFDTDGYPSQLVLAADDDNPYLLSGYNRSNDGEFKLYIDSEGVTSIYNANGLDLGAGIGGFRGGKGLPAPYNTQQVTTDPNSGYSVGVVGSGGRAAVFCYGGLDVRQYLNEGFAPLRASEATLTGATGTGNAYACLDANGKLFRSATPCV